jgi:hypothetical protein
MATLNVIWHKKHPMPMKSSLEQRVEWHLGHAKACGCREMPPTVLAELRRRRIAVRTRQSRSLRR